MENFNKIKLGNIKRKGFLKYIKKTEESHAEAFWKRKFGDEVTNNIWGIHTECTKEVRLRTLQWKIISNIYPTNILLNKMGIAATRNCTLCGTLDYIEHFFGECTLVKPLWTEIENLIASYIGKRIKLTIPIIMLGINHTSILTRHERDLINHTLLVGKLCISKYKYGKNFHLITLFYKEAELRSTKIILNK